MSEDYLVQQHPALRWNRARSVWEILGTESLLCEHLEPFSQTWPTSGMMRNGQVFELPMQEHRTTDSEFSSLPTPTAQAAKHGSTPDVGSNTPMGANLWDLPHVLPTPTTRDYKDGQAEHRRDGEVQTDTVARAVFNSGEVSATNWGKFEPAIRRWEEVLGRPAPAPTKPDGKDGNHRLSSRFTEWMMGVPEGWITDVGLSRNEELKACGNGVVPQQAELALRSLLEGLQIQDSGGQVNLPTPTVSDTFTDNLKSSQQKPGSMHSVTLPQAVKWVSGE